MALPIIPVAHFPIKHKLFPNGKILMRPFNVGLETIILQVKESKDPSEIMGAIRQIIKECVVEPEDFDIYKIPYFLIELIFLRLRERANGEEIDLQYRCNNKVPNATEGLDPVLCNTAMKIHLDLRTVDLVEDPEHTDVFMVSDDIGIKMKYPTLEAVEMAGDDHSTLATLKGSVFSIFKGDEVFFASETPDEELEAFIKQISIPLKMSIIDKFFNRLPSIKKEVEIKCDKCGFEHKIKLEGMKDFFV